MQRWGPGWREASTSYRLDQINCYKPKDGWLIDPIASNFHLQFTQCLHHSSDASHRGWERERERGRRRGRDEMQRELFKEQSRWHRDAKADKQNWIIDALPTTWVFFLRSYINMLLALFNGYRRRSATLASVKANKWQCEWPDDSHTHPHILISGKCLKLSFLLPLLYFFHHQQHQPTWSTNHILVTFSMTKSAS